MAIECVRSAVSRTRSALADLGTSDKLLASLTNHNDPPGSPGVAFTPEARMTTAMQTLALSTIGQIALSVSDVARSTAFYRDTLGMRFLFDAGPHLSFFDCDGVRLMITKPEDKDFQHPGSVLYFKVRDITSAYEGFKERGVQFIDAPHLIAPMP